jgi:hypothetical protein
MNAKNARRLALSLLLACCAAPALAASGMTLEPGMDRIGSDYTNVAMTGDDPQQCRAACLADAQCKAYTFVKPGVQGPEANCFLKNAVPAASASDCCTSGIRTIALATIPGGGTTPIGLPKVPVNLPGIDPQADVKKLIAAQAKQIAAQQAQLAAQQEAIDELKGLVGTARGEVQAVAESVAGQQSTIDAHLAAYAKHKHSLEHVRTLDGLKLSCSAAAMAGKEAAMTQCAQGQADGHRLQYNGYFSDEIGTGAPHG